MSGSQASEGAETFSPCLRSFTTGSGRRVQVILFSCKEKVEKDAAHPGERNTEAVRDGGRRRVAKGLTQA